MAVNKKNRNIKTSEIKRLFGEAANRCAICKEVLDLKHLPGSGILGEIAHIVPVSQDGPRGEVASKYSVELNSSENLILLCQNHHKEIDIDHQRYTVEKLRQLKQNHIQWIDERLNTSLAQITGLHPKFEAKLIQGFKDKYIELRQRGIGKMRSTKN